MGLYIFNATFVNLSRILFSPHQRAQKIGLFFFLFLFSRQHTYFEIYSMSVTQVFACNTCVKQFPLPFPTFQKPSTCTNKMVDNTRKGTYFYAHLSGTSFFIHTHTHIRSRFYFYFLNELLYTYIVCTMIYLYFHEKKKIEESVSKNAAV